MKYSLLVASCCFASLGTAAHSRSWTRELSLPIEPRNIRDEDISGILQVRMNKSPASSVSIRGDKPKDPGKPLRRSAAGGSVQTDSTTQRQGSPSSPRSGDPSSSNQRIQSSSRPGSSSSHRLENPHQSPAPEREQKPQQRRPSLQQSLRTTKLGINQHPFPPPLNHAALRSRIRLTTPKQTQVQHTKINEWNAPEAAGLALVHGPATVNKIAGISGVPQVTDIQKGEQALVRVRHKFTIALGGHALPGGSIMAMVKGDHVGAVVDAQQGGQGYIKDEGENKAFKYDDRRTVQVQPGSKEQQDFFGDRLTGASATAKAAIKGPGVLSIAAMRLPPGVPRDF